MADKDARKVVLQAKIKEVLADPSKINSIIDILQELGSRDRCILVECTDGLCKIFLKLIQTGACPIRKVSKLSKKKSKVCDKAEQVFEGWLSKNYTLTVNSLLELMQSPSSEVVEKVLATLFVFLKAESQKLQENSSDFTFSNDLFLRIVINLTDGLHSNDNAVKFLKPYLQYNDVGYYMLRNLNKIISKFADGMATYGGTHFVRNVHRLLLLINIPDYEEDLGNLFVISVELTETNQSFLDHNVMNMNSYKKVFTNAWMSFLSLQLDNSLYRQVLVILEKKVIPHLVDPKVLMDFLVDSYNIGGVISILALNSLFLLIHKYNLDYPDFYKKLYSLFNVEIFHLKYRARFFYLADLFLMSTHLPAYLVAAFIKRLSRLALTAPPYGVALIITFVGNLIKRHPNCKVLIHRKQEKNVQMSTEDLEEKTEKLADPFKEDEPDPSLCEALQSSLWELETLRNHYYPETKSLLELLEKPINKNETDVSEWFESSYEALFDDECTDFTKSNAFIEYHIPKGLLSGSQNELWCIDG